MFLITLTVFLFFHGSSAFQASVFQPSQFSSFGHSSKEDKPSAPFGDEPFADNYSRNEMATAYKMDTNPKSLTDSGAGHAIRDEQTSEHLAQENTETSSAFPENSPSTTAQHYRDEISSRNSGKQGRVGSEALAAKNTKELVDSKARPNELTQQGNEIPSEKIEVESGNLGEQDRVGSEALAAERTKELEDFKTRTNQLTQEVGALNSRNRQQQSLIEGLKGRLEELDGKDMEREKELKKKEYEEAKMKKEVEYLNKMLEELRRSNDEMRKQMQDNEEKMTKKIEYCERVRDDMQQDIDWQIDTLAEEKIKLDKCLKEKNALKPQSAVGSAENKTLSRKSREVHEVNKDVNCPSNFTKDEVTGICYGFIIDAPTDYQTAKQMCSTKYAGRLAVLNTKAKFNTITFASKKEYPDETFWLGGERNHGKFKWLDDSEFESYVFAGKKPENLRQRCVRLGYPSHNIDPESCISRHYAICEVIMH